MTRKLIDIGVNLTDKVFVGIYRSKQLHKNDFYQVLSRAKENGVTKMIITGGSLLDSTEAIEMALTDPSLYCTVGCHPTRCSEFTSNPDDYFDGLKQLILSTPSKVAAVGECGLDYDRLEFCPKEVQKKYFIRQLQLAFDVNLPLFLHCRAAHPDFLKSLEEAQADYYGDKSIRGVVHSFDGSYMDAMRLVQLGLFIGINGCSMKKEENLRTLESIPLNHLLIETDAPWCEIKPTHASYQFVKSHPNYKKPNKWEPNAMIKGRNEPANLLQVLEVLSEIRQVAIDELAQLIYNNTLRLFKLLALNDA